MSYMNAMQKLDEVIVGAGGQANIPFSSIPGTYRHLMLELVARGDAAAALVNASLQFNGDTGANYDYQYAQFYSTTVATGDLAGQTSFQCAILPGATAVANSAGYSITTILDYARTTWWKCADSRSQATGSTTGGSNRQIQNMQGLWRSTAAITSILLFPASGNFIVGSVASLYGWL